MGLVEDETGLQFSEAEAAEGIGPDTRDRILRTLIRNTYNFHMNEIFATVQNEYTDWTWQGPTRSSAVDAPIRPGHLQWAASRALTDKLYMAPALMAANWCNHSAFPTFFYIYSHCVSPLSLSVVDQTTQPRKLTASFRGQKAWRTRAPCTP